MVNYFDDEKVLIDVIPKRDLVSRINSSVSAYLWDIDQENKKLVKPEVKNIIVPLYIPTRVFWGNQVKKQEKELIDAFNTLKDNIKEKYSENKINKESELKDKNPHTKKAKRLQKRIALLDKGIKNVDNSFKYGLVKRKNRFNFILKLPYLTKKEKLLLSDFIDPSYRYYSKSFLIRRALGYTGNILHLTGKEYRPKDHDNLLLKHVNFQDRDTGELIINTHKLIEQKFLKNSSKETIDIETTSWKNYRLNKEERNLSKEELVEKFNLDEYLKRSSKGKVLEEAEAKKDLTREERIVIGARSNTEKDEFELVTVFPTEDIKVRFPGKESTIKPKIIEKSNHKEILKYFNGVFKDSDTLWLFGHNHPYFDVPKFQELGIGDLKIGVNGVKPRFIPGTNFKKGYHVPGRIDLDPSTLYLYLVSWTVSQRLDHVFEDTTGEFDKKIMNHSELEKNIQYALDESNPLEKRQTIINELHYYGITDPIKSEIICSNLMDVVMKMSRALNNSIDRLSFASRKPFIGEYWANWSLDKKGVFPYKNPENEHIIVTDELKRLKQYQTTTELEWDDFRMEEFESRLINYHIKKNKEDTESSKKGGYKAKLFYFHPLIKGLKDFYYAKNNKYNKHAKEIYNYKGNPKKKAMMYNALNWIVEYPFFKILQLSDEKLTEYMEKVGEVSERNFSAGFNLGFSGNNLQEYHNKLVSYFETISQNLAHVEIINSYKNYFLIKDNENSSEMLKKLEDSNLGTLVAEGNVLSIKKNVFALNNDGQPMLFGMANPLNKQGEKNELERKLLYNTLRGYFIDKDISSVLKSIREASNIVQSGQAGDSVIYKKEAARNFTDYSIAAKQNHVKIMRKRKIRKGQELKYKKKPNDLTDKLFGFRKVKSKLGETVYELTNNSKVKDLLYGSIPMDMNDASIKKTKHFLAKVLTGIASDKEIEFLKNKYEFYFSGNKEQTNLF